MRCLKEHVTVTESHSIKLNSPGGRAEEKEFKAAASKRTRAAEASLQRRRRSRGKGEAGGRARNEPAAGQSSE